MNFQSVPKRGNLWPALAISFLLHFLLLWPASSPHRGGDIAQPLVATLRTVLASATAPLPLKPIIAPARERREPAIQSPAPQQVPAPIATAPAPNNLLDSTAQAPLRSERSTDNAQGITGGATLRGPAFAAAAAGDAVDADGMRQYRLALASQASRYKRYPARALEANVGGTVEIRVAVATGGLPQEVQLARSSGSDLLDDAALDMIKQAAPRTTVPELLRSRAFVVSLPVVFDLASE